MTIRKTPPPHNTAACGVPRHGPASATTGHNRTPCRTTTARGGGGVRARRQKWTAEELAWLADVRTRLAGPLTDAQLAVLRHWWNGGYAADATDDPRLEGYSSD
ncbi:hypothetical protein ACFXHA_05250 [Nocardia sp. NPDC059240]|uniref:hypothetical protein n=1 Tax=Nocardia sp. NPDC059240 TaxID=3346786 RepID=UPI003675F1A0